MQDSINLKIISSEKVIANEKVNYVFVPNLAGKIKILPNHCNYTGMLSTGTISYQKKDTDIEDSLKVVGGVCSLINNDLKILVDL